MNDIEQLVRESLQSAPMPEILVGDPVAAVARRAARARAFIVGGVATVALVVTAAVVVPMTTTHDSHRSHGRVNITVPPSPRPNTTSGHAATMWWPKGSVQVTVGGGSLWHLRRETKPNSEQMYVDEVNPLNHALRNRWKASTPADFIAYGLDRVWVWGGGDGGYPDGLLSTINPTDGSGDALTNRRGAFNGIAFLNGRAWVTVKQAVWQLNPSGLGILSNTRLPAATTQQGIVATQSGQLWVRTAKSWVRIDPASHRVVDTVSWAGPMLGAAGNDAIWTYDRRLIALSPSLLHQGVSVAEGSRIAVPGPVTAVAASSDNGLFVVAADGPDLSSATSNLYYLSERQLTGTAAINAQTPNVADVSAYQLAADGAGGVNYSSDDAGMHWSP